MKTTINGIEYESLPAGKTMKELGYKKGDWFIYVGEDKLKHGTKLRLHYDDDSVLPFYEVMDNDHIHHIGEHLNLYVSNLAPYIRTIDDVQEGDVVTDGTYFRYVHGRCGSAVFTSYDKESVGDANTSTRVDILSIGELKEDGYRLHVPTPTPTPALIEITLDDIAKKYGAPVEQLRIKE